MAVKNYTTGIPSEKTIMEIEQILVRFGAKGILKEYIGSQTSCIMFYLEREGQKIPFKLPMSIEKARNVIVKAVKEKKLPYRFSQEPLRSEQAQRVGWRLIKDWIHLQLSLLEVEFAEPLELLLPYAYNPVENKTIYEKIIENKEKFLAIEDKENG